MGDAKVTADHAELLLVLLRVEGKLDRLTAELEPLLPHIPAALRLLDNPASRWKRRRDERADTRA